MNHLRHLVDLSVICNRYVEPFTEILFPVRAMTIEVANRKSQRSGEIWIDLMSNKESASLIQSIRPDRSIGFEDSPVSSIYTDLIPTPGSPSDRSMAEVYLSPLSHLSFNGVSQMSFECNVRWRPSPNSGPILLAPSAGNNPSRRWDLSNFIILYSQAKRRFPEVKFLLGPAEIDLVYDLPREYEVVMSTEARKTVSHLLGSTLVVASEGGIMHVAAALGVPTLGLFVVASPRNWFPYTGSLQKSLGDGKNQYGDPLPPTFSLNDVFAEIERIYEQAKDFRN